MNIETIDKSTYRKHLNIVIVVAAVSLAVLSLAISQTTIYLFTDREGTHFWLNLMGVVVSVVILGGLLNKYKHHPFMKEVYYVWQLKQQINYIYRKQKKIDAAVETNDIDALTIMRFYYLACEQLYTLDDNTITMDSLALKSNALNARIDELNVDIKASNYQQKLLDKF